MRRRGVAGLSMVENRNASALKVRSAMRSRRVAELAVSELSRHAETKTDGEFTPALCD
jgi:hypothetical protein